MKKITCLAGGVGAARFLSGLRNIISEKDLTIIVNTGDDEDFHGLRVSPDVDIICYTLAGIVDEEKGWGVKDDTFNCLRLLGEYRSPTWFRIGDKDFATHILRTQLLQEGYTITEATKAIAESLGLTCRILPMSNSRIRTMIQTPKSRLSFQEYFVRERFQPKIAGVHFEHAEDADPTVEVQEAIREADGIVICPSNPIVSIGPILYLKDLRSILKARKRQTVAISPIVKGRTLKGPADQMMRSLGHESSAFGVAQLYSDIVDTMIIDKQDRDLKAKIEQIGMKCVITDTIMTSQEKKIRLAEAAIRCLEVPA